MSVMTWEEFLQQEEDLEKYRREQRREKDAKRAAEERERERVVDVEKLAAAKKAEQRALRRRIEDRAARLYAEGSKKKYDLGQPANGEVEWLVFDKATGELLGTATAWRPYDAWSKVSPYRIEQQEMFGKLRDVMLTIGYAECRCVTREDWLAAEERLRAKKMNGSNGR